MRCFSWALTLLFIFTGIADAGRGDDELDSGVAAAASKDLKTENAALKQELDELRHELRVGAKGSFIQKASTESREASDVVQADETPKGPHKHHKHKGGSRSKQHLTPQAVEPALPEPAAPMPEAEKDAYKQYGITEAEEALVNGVEPMTHEEILAKNKANGELPSDLKKISEQIAQDARVVAKAVEEQRMVGEGVQVANKTFAPDGHGDGKVLFIVYSSSKYYDTRIRWLKETWARGLKKSQLVVIGDGSADSLPAGLNVNFHQSRCSPKDSKMEMCCKYAEAVVLAQTMMWQYPNLQWAYMVDDDSYIRAEALQQSLLKQPRSRPKDRGLVLANYGCVTASCSDLMCGSSGYAANRWAIDVMAAGDPGAFVQETMKNCNRCGGDALYNRGLWGDAGLSEVIKDRGIEQRKLDGIYGWMLDKSCLEFSLESEHEPLLYHQIESRQQMELLHRLFASPEDQALLAANQPGSAAVDGLGGCVEFRGNVQCALSRAEQDRPWHHGPSLCQHSRMPRLPLLFGIFILFLLFIIVATFVWAGFRYQMSGDAWKLESIMGLKWHSYPMAGKSRFR